MFANAIADFSSATMKQQQNQISEEEQKKLDDYYLTFKAGDKILIQQKTNGGWWYGFVYTQDMNLEDLQQNKIQVKSGYFPENYVQPILPKKPPGPPPKKQLKENQDYKEYAQEIVKQEERKKLIHDLQYQQQNLLEAQKQVEQQMESIQKQDVILGEAEFKKLKQQKMLQQQQQQQQSDLKRTYQELDQMRKQQEQEKLYQLDGMQSEFGVKGYKKVKLTGENYEGLKANKEVKIDEAAGIAYLPVKDQSQLARSHRQLNIYFDYDSWNDKMNQQGGPKKSRPDPSKKKEKKNKVLEKLLNDN